MRLSCAALVALTIAVLPVPSRAQDGVFVSYEAMRATLDGLMKSRSIADLMIVFGGADEMTEQQLAGLEGQVQRGIETQGIDWKPRCARSIPPISPKPR